MSNPHLASVLNLSSSSSLLSGNRVWKLSLIVSLFFCSACGLGGQSGVLDAFEQNNRQMRQSLDIALTSSQELMASARRSLTMYSDSMGLWQTDSTLSKFDTLDIIENETRHMLNELDIHLAEMEKLAEVDPETGLFQNRAESERPYVYWLEDDRAKTLRRKFQAHDSLMISMNRGVVFSASTLTNEKLWRQFDSRRPVISHIATLEGMKLGILHQQLELLRIINGNFEAPYYRPDQLVAFSVPSSRIITAGLPFHSRIFVGYTSDQLRPRFFGEGLTPDSVENYASITLAADAGIIKEGEKLGYQDFSATVQVPKMLGGYRQLEVEDKFLVRKPELIVNSKSMLHLFLNCGNHLNIEVPDLDTFYHPILNSIGGEVIPISDSSHDYTVVPKEDSCIIQVSNQIGEEQISVGDLIYKVVEPPKPTIRLVINDKVFNGISLVASSSRVMLYLDAEQGFKQSMPGDARYGVTDIDVLAQLTLDPPVVVNTVSGIGKTGEKGIPIDLGETVRNALPGTRIYIRINGIFRVNFQGEEFIDDRFTEVERTIGLVVRQLR